MLLGIILQCGPPCCTLPKNAFLSPLGKRIYLETQFGQDNISGNSVEMRVY